jgi:hypothetical protein
VADYTRVEVEANDNSLMSADQVYRSIGEPFLIKQVRIYEGEPEGKLCNIVGWSSEDGGRPVQVYAVQIEDSSQGVAYLVYGSDWGVRLAPAESTSRWSIHDPDQTGETHLVMADLEDIVPA